MSSSNDVPAVAVTRICSVMIAGVLAISLAGCTPTPNPSPTPTPAFTDEAAAFAAAEQVYRAYNDALNARRRGDAEADPQQYLVGAALEGFIDSQNSLDSLNLRVEGDAAVRSFSGKSADLESGSSTVTGLICIDVSAVALWDEQGTNVTPQERGDMIAQAVTFTAADGGFQISYESQQEVGQC